MNFAVSEKNTPTLQALLGAPEMEHIAGFIDYGIAAYFPKIHCLLTNPTEILLDMGELHLKQPFPNCCYATSQLNFSRASTDPHLDFINTFF
ncbi:hypothetical protein EV359DRAFT_88379 [Lentinula novae-zelandiae]|nr:hypothetical protein EV359DRAFT_88379 [Lentinula novae-zelandiae]